MKTFFTSDTHFGHANIIGYCQRPFSSLEEMDETMISQWNEVVGPDDTVYHLGDFALGPAGLIPTYRNRLAGRIVLVLGNHDRHGRAMNRMGFETVRSALIETCGGPTFLAHRPVIDSTMWRDAIVHFCGHVHGHWNRMTTRDGLPIYNVGVDVRGFRPVRAEEIFKK